MSEPKLQTKKCKNFDSCRLTIAWFDCDQEPEEEYCSLCMARRREDALITMQVVTEEILRHPFFESLKDRVDRALEKHREERARG